MKIFTSCIQFLIIYHINAFREVENFNPHWPWLANMSISFRRTLLNQIIREITGNVQENEILHEIFRLVPRFPRYISCYISENRLPLGQCSAMDRMQSGYFVPLYIPTSSDLAQGCLVMLVAACSWPSSSSCSGSRLPSSGTWRLETINHK